MQRQYVMDDATPGLRSILGGNVRKYANTAKCERSQDAKAFQGRVPSFGLGIVSALVTVENKYSQLILPL